MPDDAGLLAPAREVAAMWRLPEVQAVRRQAAALWRLGYGDDVPAEAEPAFEGAMDEYVTNYLLKGSACDTDHPRFVRDFQSPAEVAGAGLRGARMGGDNPDNIYRLAAIAHGTAYRVTGRVVGRSAPDVSFSLMGNWGTSVGIATIGLHELEVDPDGTFTLTIDDRAAGDRRNHLTSAANAKFLFVRDSLMDWNAETALDLAIARLGPSPRPPLGIEEKAARVCFRLIEDVPLYYWFTRLFSGRPANGLSTPVKVSSMGGLATQTSAMGRLSLASDEAAVIRYDPAGARYVGLALYDWWFRSIDVDARQSSLTGAMAAPDADGRITCVACVTDPGIANWIDPGGLGETLALLRWQGLPPVPVRDGPVVEIRVVKRDAVDGALPAGTVRIVAIVTGAGGALGRAYCKLLAARGASVVANDLGGSPTGEGTSTGFADAIVDEMRAAGGRGIANYDSVATPEGGRAIVAAALDAFGRVDIVVNNAGNQRNGRFEDLTEADIDMVFAVHVKGAFFVTQPAYREMVKQGYGRIVMTSSQSGIFGNPIRGNYGSAKTALIGLMNVIAQEAPAGVLVNAIFPNAVGGRLGGKPGDARPDLDFLKAAGERARHYLAGMDPAFVAAIVAYLASDACTTSQNMYSVLGGKFSRLFVGATKGWYQPGSEAPSPEDIVAHLAEIDDRSRYDVPLSGLDEMDTAVVAAVRRRSGDGTA